MVRGSGALTLPLLDQASSGGTRWTQQELLLLKMVTLLVKTVGGEGSRTGQFDWPWGIALSKDNTLFVCDKYNHRIQVFDTDLKFISCFCKEGSAEGQPTDLTFDHAGDVYVTDHYDDCVQVFSQNGTFLRTFSRFGSGPGELSNPLGIHVDHDYVYVVEYGNCRVSVFYTSGEFITPFGRRSSGEGELSHPYGIPLTRMDSCMSVMLGTIVFKYFEHIHT